MPIADLTRQRLARAALEHFTTRGYETTTTAQIAKKAGVSEGAIYRHFTGKQELLNELYRASARWATEVLQQAEAAGGTPRDRLARLAQAGGVGGGVAQLGVPRARPAVITRMGREGCGGGAGAGGGVGRHRRTVGRSDCLTVRRSQSDATVRRSSSSAISGGTKILIGTPTTPMPRLTYNWLFPFTKWPITYLVMSRPADQPTTGM